MEEDEENYDDNIEYQEDEYIDLEENESTNINKITVSEDIFLDESELLKEREKIISEASEKLFLSRNDTILAMIYLQWDLDKIDTIWYENVENHKIKSGIELSAKVKNELKKKGIQENSNFCSICFEEKDEEQEKNNNPKFYNLKCGHVFCADCWKDYLGEKIKNPLGGLRVTCPQGGCTLIVYEELYKKFLGKDYLEQINKMIFRDFINKNKDIKQCPNPKCHVYVKSTVHSSKEINCPCGYFYCFNCMKISHRPCSCDIVQKWDIKRGGKEDPDELYIKAYTKECPHCGKRIEKSMGCNYMYCDPKAGGCGKAFCYVCGTDWAKHSQDHFNCNKYTQYVKEKEKEQEKIKKTLKENERYNFYFTRFLNYEESVKVINKSLRQLLKEKIELISGLFNLPKTELSFINEAFINIYKNKNNIKNSYIFGYFMKDNDKKKLFEVKQGLLESNVEKLHKMLIDDTINNMIQTENFDLFNELFNGFRNTVINLIEIINRYAKNLFEEIENFFISEIDAKLINEFTK